MTKVKEEVKSNQFIIGEKEIELKLTFQSVKYLSGIYDGGAMALIGRALQGDIDTFVHIVHAGLFHAKERYTLKAVEAAINEGFEAERIDLGYVLRTGKDVVVDSFFFKATVQKLMANEPEAMRALDELTK